MIKKIAVIFLCLFLVTAQAIAAVDKTSEDYLKNKRHFAIMKPLAEKIGQRVIKKSLKKETKGKYKVKLEGYTVSSMKKGIFRDLQINGKNLEVEGVEIPYMKLRTDTDYNWIDYSKEPVVFKSDITLSYELGMDENCINSALKTEKYDKKLQSVNRHAYPLFTISDVRLRIKHDKLHIIMEYNFPIKPAKKNRTFMVSSKINVINGRVKLSNIGFDNAYGNLPLNKVTNLVNLIDPLSFTLDLIDNKKCDGNIESIKIVDDVIIVNGKIYIKGEK